jgi:hypothetical protein
VQQNRISRVYFSGVEAKLLGLIEREYGIMNEVPFSINQRVGENGITTTIPFKNYEQQNI